MGRVVISTARPFFCSPTFKRSYRGAFPSGGAPFVVFAKQQRIMPTPHANESRKDFVSRCIPIVLDEGTARDSKQAAAICNSMWQDRKEIMGNEVTINIGTGGEAPEVVEKQDDTNWFDDLVARVKEALGKKDEHPASPTTGLMLWKEADRYHWLARYSNNFRDQDNPPEIISAKSHQRFVELVDKGDADLPELWLWHRPEWKWGQANWVAWDDAGFAVAGGTVDKGKEDLAGALAKVPADELRVSHGMPKKSIKRDPDDESIIVEHITREISPLPAWAAANSMTGFIMSKEVTDMAIPDEKLDELREQWHLSDEILETLQAANAAEAEEGKQAGIEQKEKSDEEAPEEEPESKDTQPLEEPEPEPEPAEEPPVSRAEMQQALETIGQAINELSGRIKQIGEQVTTVEKQKAVEEAATLSEIFERAIGHKDARVDGRTSQAKDRPAETRENEPGVINSGNPLADSIVNDIVSGKWRTDLPQ